MLYEGFKVNTEIWLKYADADNYKSFIRVVLAGEITAEHIHQISQKLEFGDSLVAAQLGLPTPSEELEREQAFPNESDHVWTSLEAFESGLPKAEELHTNDSPTTSQYCVEQFVEAISTIREWDIVNEMKRLDMCI